MTIEELVQRFDDLVNALQRIADALDDVTDQGRVKVQADCVDVT